MLDRAVRIGMIGCGTQANVHFAGIKALGRRPSDGCRGLRP